ncbi:MAG: Omp28-related outer membrane protein [Saprospiraceae bacterium]|nr:Omp28-related outer membrane protein [Saprospiraceae bacterium]
MKKLYTFLLILASSGLMVAQSTFTTSFDFTTFASDWQQESLASDGGWSLFDPNASSVLEAGFPAPGGDWQYAYTADGMCNCDKSNDLLILPGTYSTDKNWTVVFEYYFPGTSNNVSGENVSVLYSKDGGNTWVSLLTLDPAGYSWHTAVTGLKTANIQGDIQFAIRYSDNGGQGTGVAIDNLSLVPSDGANIHVAGKIQSDTPVFVGNDVMVQVSVSNLGDEDIYGVALGINMEGQTPYTEEIEEIEIPSMSTFEFEYPVSIDAPGLGTFSMTVNPLGASDPYTDDNVFDVLIASVDANSIQHGILAEEATGTWCGWCPRGAVFMDLLSKKYDDFIGVAVHNGDPMVNTVYDSWMSGSVGGYPSAHVQRKFKDFNPSDLEANYLEAKNIAPPAELSLDIDYDESTRMLNATVTGNFLMNVISHRFNLILSEDGVAGTGAGWSQSNYYAGGGQGPMGGYESLPNPVPAAQMVYDHVARTIAGGANGAPGTLPFLAKTGEMHSYTFNVQLDMDWNPENIHVIGVLHNDQSKSIANVVSTTLLGTSSSDLPAFVGKLDLFPNPATTEAFLRLQLEQAQPVSVQISDVLGRIMASRDYGVQTGDQVLPVLIQDWPAGMYQMMITVGTETVSRPLVVGSR